MNSASGINDNGSGTDGCVAWAWKGGSPITSSGGSVRFDANGDYLSLASTSDFDFGTGDFTLELYFRCDGYGNTPYMLEFRASGGYEAGSIVCYVQSSGEAVFWHNGSNRVISNSVITLSKWTHIAYVRHSGTTKMYIDGVAQSQTYTDTNDYGDGGRPLLIGVRRHSGSTLDNQSWDGELSNVRIVKGTAVYTSNFTPSSTPLTNITNTKLLCCQTIRSATEAAVSPGSITVNGGCAPTSMNPFDAFSIDGVGYASASAAGLDGGTANPTGASVNTKAGFSIISYTATNNQNVSYSHGLNQAPEIIITKDRDNSRNWGVYYTTAGTNTNWMSLNTADAVGSNNSGTTPVGGSSGTYMYLHQDYFSPAYSAFANGGNDGNDKIIAYMWHSVPGYSKMGSYFGNGQTDGKFVYTGFKPAFVLLKRHTDSSNYWEIRDNKRNPHNPANERLFPNRNDTKSVGEGIDFLSNGFKIRNSGSGSNSNDKRYIYMAFAEQPLTTQYGTQSNAE